MPEATLVHHLQRFTKSEMHLWHDSRYPSPCTELGEWGVINESNASVENSLVVLGTLADLMLSSVLVH